MQSTTSRRREERLKVSVYRILVEAGQEKSEGRRKKSERKREDGKTQACTDRSKLGSSVSAACHKLRLSKPGNPKHIVAVLYIHYGIWTTQADVWALPHSSDPALELSS